MNEKEKTLSVSAIKSGSVIDHIPAGYALRIIHLLKLADNEKRVTVGLNLKSQCMGLKDLIKIEEFFLSPAQAAQIAIFAPKATVNVIENYKVAKKFQVEMPEVIAAVLRCPNPRCVTQSEPVSTLFTIEETNQKILLRCRYCETTFMHGALCEKA
jgi:aspartate carbamoyltransferase regulatory subunit